MRIVKQNRFKNLGELHKELTESGIKVSRATTHRHVKEFGYSCHPEEGNGDVTSEELGRIGTNWDLA